MMTLDLHGIDRVDVSTDENNGTRWVKLLVRGNNENAEITLFPNDGKPVDMSFAKTTDCETLAAHKRIT